jgi:hypothetical protein
MDIEDLALQPGGFRYFNPHIVNLST